MILHLLSIQIKLFIAILLARIFFFFFFHMKSEEFLIMNKCLPERCETDITDNVMAKPHPTFI